MTIDVRAVAAGAAAGLVLALPAVILGSLFGAGFAVLVLVGLVGAGFVAASKRPDAPFTHGLLGAVALGAAVLALSVAATAAKGDRIHVTVVAFDLVVAAGCGVVGGRIAAGRAAR